MSQPAGFRLRFRRIPGGLFALDEKEYRALLDVFAAVGESGYVDGIFNLLTFGQVHYYPADLDPSGQETIKILGGTLPRSYGERIGAILQEYADSLKLSEATQ